MNKEWPDEPVKLSDETMDEFVSEYPLALVDFWAEWCGPCKMLIPVLDELAKDMHGKVAIGKVNVDENRGKSGEYGISSIPTLMIYKDGEMVKRLVGALPKDALKKELENFI